MDRRDCLHGLLGCGLGLSPFGLALAQQTPPRPRLKLLVPANPGGGWDQTAKAVAATLQAAKLVEQVEFEHKPGKGGAPGLAYFVDKYAGDPNTLMVGGMVMLGAVAINHSPVDLSRVQPVAKLTTDYLVVAVPKDSPIRNVKALADRMKADPHSLVFGGGSAGGVDHMLMGMIGRSVGADVGALKYTPTSAGAEFTDLLRKGTLSVGIAGYSEFKDALADGSVRAIAISSRAGLYGLPSLREQGVATDLGNWRGLFAPPGLPAEQVEGWIRLFNRMAAAPEWKAALDKNNWRGSPLYGAEFRNFVELEQTTARVIVHLLKLQA
ncbi:MAG TPA: tripartite tricarboxylate transporter substrate-binding protein [Albitalea sp.]|uniref:Bug family tripartite tricarboxylate transporter substrate binding protein n=1 Tax=Piscinibacter sp. TaxID=1903157 RepID=UPI002ED163BF